ncbi:MAG: putative molybdenum carrier protein [Pseudomonadota bacterium]
MLERIISGGQTGADRGALDAALARGFPCGGWCPPDRRSEDGEIPARYPVEPMASGGYRRRTIRNLKDADGTAIFYREEITGGTELTLAQCIRHRRPYRLIDLSEVTPERAVVILQRFVERHDLRVLNVAGPRASGAPGIRDEVEEAVGGLLDQVG